jgi:hypothetical protein
MFAEPWPGPAVGNPAAPYLTALAGRGADFTDSHGIARPSQPGYLALFSGSTHAVTGDSCPHTFLTRNLGGDLIAAGKSFTGYAESLPSAGVSVCSTGSYLRTDVPWSDFSDVPMSATKALRSFPQAATADFGSLPDVSFVTPSLCARVRPCTVTMADRWLSAHLGAYIRYALHHDSLLIVTFAAGDSDRGDGSTVIPIIFVGDHVRAGTSASASINTTSCGPWRTCSACPMTARLRPPRRSPASWPPAPLSPANPEPGETLSPNCVIGHVMPSRSCLIIQIPFNVLLP